MQRESLKRAKSKYNAKCKHKYILLNPDNDIDIIVHIDTIDNFNQYIKKLIREDIERVRD